MKRPLGMMALGTPVKEGVERRARDFYPTPAEAVIALLKPEALIFPTTIWEPAVGTGSLARGIESFGHKVIGTDIETGDDFLKETKLRAPKIITNPPWNLAVEFIEKAHELGADYIAFLLKSSFFQAAKRVGLFEKYPPSRVCQLTWRLDFTGGGAPALECSWFVWDKSFPRGAETRFFLLKRPEKSPC